MRYQNGWKRILDGTLMKKDQTISAFTAKAINMLVKQGLHFS
ncbi:MULTISPECIES: HAD hydrolase family protein [Eisenbergiella]|uniref:HAD hydrolase family protein n=1 Tax=Eisenbergiella porci TaxID=2652274 RepID=A0A6N7VVS3_9FIRM|nr:MULTISPECIES: HAD hydrolase family protein [Eisenbergiella]MCI6706551.1 HAD hydrolase family protein [Eisenbergiella massiliensis]MDY2654017.1 HAD hydrolase family protein [Eisenbergiella porci]MDY5527190.1 HAD hydrolase family protein [Eisenbergiella porci]MSS87141.1 HAD hydrolase family protein [Eisenbergiella porci]